MYQDLFVAVFSLEWLSKIVQMNPLQPINEFTSLMRLTAALTRHTDTSQTIPADVSCHSCSWGDDCVECIHRDNGIN